MGLGLSGLTGIFGLATFIQVAKGGLDNSAFATGVITAISLGGSLALRHRAIGHTVDAMNYYNDQVGSLGATCPNPSYPRPLKLPQEPVPAAAVPARAQPACTGGAADSAECTDPDHSAEAPRAQPPEPSAAAAAEERPPTRALPATNEKIELRQKIHFSAGNDQLPPEAKSQIDEVFDTLQRVPTLRILIAGNSDAHGTAAEKRRLSQLRAEVVQRYLLDRGIAAERLGTIGFGSAQPLCSAPSAACDTQNRRVEFIIVAQ